MMAAEFFSLTMILAVHAFKLSPAARVDIAGLIFDIAHENNA